MDQNLISKLSEPYTQCTIDQLDDIINKIIKLFDIKNSSVTCDNCSRSCHNITGCRYHIELSEHTFIKIFGGRIINEELILDLNARLRERKFSMQFKMHLFDNLKKKIEEPSQLRLANNNFNKQIRIIRVNQQMESTLKPIKDKLNLPGGIILSGELLSEPCIYKKFIKYDKIYTGEKEETYNEPIYVSVDVKRTEVYTELIKSKEEIWTPVYGHRYGGQMMGYERTIPITKSRVVDDTEQKVVGYEKKTRMVPAYGKEALYEAYLSYVAIPILICVWYPTTQECDKCSCLLCTSSDKLFVFGSITEQWNDYFLANVVDINTCLLCGGDHHLKNDQSYKFKSCDPIIKLYDGDIFEGPNDKYFKSIIKPVKVATKKIEYEPCTICSCYRCIVDMNTNFISNAIYGLQFRATQDDIEVLQYRINQKNPILKPTISEIRSILNKIAKPSL